eukprot:Skav224681  [mRNA]  locus=scaffold1804:142043:142696:+ [translate_table: standard]
MEKMTTYLDDKVKTTEEQTKGYKSMKADVKTKLSERQAPMKEELRKQRQKASNERRKEEKAEDREKVIKLTVRTNIVDDKESKDFGKQKGKEVEVKIKQGATAGKLKDKILEQIGKRAPKGKSDIIFIKKGSKEIYNFGPQKCGLRRLHTLGVSDGDAVDFSYGFDQKPPVITEADTLAQSIGGNAGIEEDKDDINEEDEEESGEESDISVDDEAEQ